MNSDPTRLTGGAVDPAAATRVGPAAPTGPGAAADATTVQAGVADPAAADTAGAPPLHGIPPGTLLVNTYRVERLLGGGGMGEVYLARHAGLATLHAVKVIRPAMVANHQVMDLFYREAKVLRGVRHDAVVSYDGFVRDADGRDYLVMEFVEGPSLAERLRRGQLPVDQVLALRDRLAAGLAQAHRQGAIHRDISPDNVILPGERVDSAKLIDFGLSKLTDPTQETIIGASFAGKLRFAAPEQFGMFGGEVDARSDIYSLGLTLAAAARGRPLDMGNSFAAALRAREVVPDLSELPPALRPWLSAMLEPDPARRPASLDALLRRWPAATQAVAAPARGGSAAARTKPPGGRTAQRATLLWGGLGAVLALAAGWGLYVVLRPLETVPPRPPAPTATTIPGTPQPQPGPPEPGSPPPPAGDLAALVQGGRDDQALSAARALIAANADAPAGARTALPADAFLALAESLRAAGRPAEAFVLVEALIGGGAAPPAALLWPLAQDLRAAGRLDPYFFLVRALAGQGDGPAAFAYGELYDPLHWTPRTSPFTKPRADKARDWYEKAAALGVAAAAARLEALKAAAPGD